MNVLIVEDETAAFETLAQLLQEQDPSIRILANTESVTQTIRWLKANPAPSLIFLDIHLSDGSAFLLFEQLTIDCPIIFTTAYDEYALQAFQVNSIGYLLKPIKENDLQRALAKFKRWSHDELSEYVAKLSQLSPGPRYADKILVPSNDKLLPISISAIAYFYTTDKSTSIGLKDGSNIAYNKTLEQIYASLDPALFYRANKQFIIARDAVVNMTIWFDSRLLLSLDVEVPERIYVSKNKAADFKRWLVRE